MPETSSRARSIRGQTSHVRTPNAERTARARSKLLNAAIASLYELGYHQTSTVVVAERAKVSRGSMLYHFPTKADLMLAVAKHVVELRSALHAERLKPLASAQERFAALIDVLWEAMLSPSGIARVELMLSSRSDPEMADRFNEINDALDRRHKEVVWRLAEQLGLDKRRHKARIDAFVQLYAASLRGLAIDALRRNSRDGAHASVALLKTMQLKLLEEMLKEAPRRR